MKKLISIVLVLVMALSLFTACGAGADGLDGKNGQDGIDGIAPQVKIGEDACWYVSYDEGATWQSLGVKATGEDGAPGAKGETGTKGETGSRGETGNKGGNGNPTYMWVKFADQMPTSDADLKDTVSSFMGVYNGNSATPPTSWNDYQWIRITPEVQEPEVGDQDFNVLFIGNSFLNTENASGYIYKMAESLGKTNIKVGDLYKSGSNMNDAYSSLKGDKTNFAYWENTDGSWVKTSEGYSMRAAVQEREWDYIVIHQSISNAGKPETFSNFVDYVSLLRYLCPGAKIMFLMSWTYAEGATSEKFESYYGSDVQDMYNRIVSAIQAEVLPLGVEVIPCGTAVANARASGVEESLITYDSYTDGIGHLTSPGQNQSFGRYLVCLTVISKLTGLPIDDIAYSSKNLTAEQKALAIACVNSAISNPYTITDCSVN